MPGRNRKTTPNVNNDSSSSYSRSDSSKNAARLPSFANPAQFAIVPYGNTSIEPQDRLGFDGFDDRDMPTIVGDDGLFSTKKPKDVAAGISSGLKSFGKGLALGAVSAVALPIHGASQQGFSGFIKGLGQGLVTGVMLPVTGFSVGLYQSVRGVVNTAEAVHQKSAGQKWDKKTREWKRNWYSLPEENEMIESVDVANAADKAERKSKRKQVPLTSTTNDSPQNVNVKDTKLYDVLNLPPNATQAEIRKSYYKLARDNHPDKNPNDPHAKERFQQLGEAYQVLADEERRIQYNTYGSSATNDMPIVDSSFFFTMLFGSTTLEPFIGKLKMAMVVELMMDSDSDGADSLSNESIEFEQRAREVKLAILLRDRLTDYTDAVDDESRSTWMTKMQEEAFLLCEASFGDAIVNTVGWVYSNYSSQYLGKLDSFMGVQGHYAKFQAQNRNFTAKLQIGTTLVKTTLAARKLQKMECPCSNMNDENENVEFESPSKISSTDNINIGNEMPTEPITVKGSKVKTPLLESVSGASIDEKTKGSEDSCVKDSKKEAKKKIKEGKDDAKEKRTQEEGIRQLEETLPLILETILGMCLLDIDDTLTRVCKKVLKDMSVELEVRKERAEGLSHLGRILQSEASTSKKTKGKIDARKQMEEALIMAAQHADDLQKTQTP